MPGYVLGVDAGATKSKLAIFTETGKKTGLYSWGSLNHESLPGSFSQLEEELGQFIRQSLSEAGVQMKEVRYAVFFRETWAEAVNWHSGYSPRSTESCSAWALKRC